MSVFLLNTQLHYSASNSLLIIICILLILWFVKASRRFLRALTVRAHMLRSGNDLMEIQGLGSFLNYFDEVSRLHVHSIVHTRQTKPAVGMSALFVPLTLQRLLLINEGPTLSSKMAINASGVIIQEHRHQLEVSVSSMAPGKLILLSKFQLAQFKAAVVSHVQSHQHGRRTSSPATLIPWLRKSIFNVDSPSDASSMGTMMTNSVAQAEAHVAQWLTSKEIIDRALARHIPAGESCVRFDLSIIKDSPGNLSSMSAADTTEYALVFVGTNTAREMALPSTLTAISTPDATAAAAAEHDHTIDSARDADEREPINPHGQHTSDHRDPSHDQQLRSSTSFSSFSASLNHWYQSMIPLVQLRPSAVPLHDPATQAESSQGDGVVDVGQINVQPRIAPELHMPVATIFALTLVEKNGNLNAVGNDSTDTLSNASSAHPNGNHNHSHAKSSKSTHGVADHSTPSSSRSIPPMHVPTKIDVLPREVYLLTTTGQLFQSLEIFGLNSATEAASRSAVDSGAPSSLLTPGKDTGSAAQPPHPSAVLHKPVATANLSPSPGNSSKVSPDSTFIGMEYESPRTPSHASDGTAKGNEESESTSVAGKEGLVMANGGFFPSDECVVCLTERKKVLLLPCRHLCVCSSCLLYVDKCPVCRALFEEYVVVQHDQQLSFNVRQ